MGATWEVEVVECTDALNECAVSKLFLRLRGFQRRKVGIIIFDVDWSYVTAEALQYTCAAVTVYCMTRR